MATFEQFALEHRAGPCFTAASPGDRTPFPEAKIVNNMNGTLNQGSPIFKALEAPECKEHFGHKIASRAAPKRWIATRKASRTNTSRPT